MTKFKRTNMDKEKEKEVMEYLGKEVPWTAINLGITHRIVKAILRRYDLVEKDGEDERTRLFNGWVPNHAGRLRN